MNALDLDTIKAKIGRIADSDAVMLDKTDARALVAEVEHLQGLLDRTFRAYLSIQGIPDDQIDAEVARRNSATSDSSSTGGEQ